MAGFPTSSPMVVHELYRRASFRSCDPPDLATLLAQAGDGDHAALKQLYQATSAKLFGIISRVLFDRYEAEDVLQEVYVTVWRHAARYDAARASPMTWLITIARNRAIDRLRARVSRPTTTLDGAAEVCDAAPSVDLRLEQNQEGQRLAAALATLDPRYADAIRSIFFERLTYAALAAREGISANTLKSWVRRGLPLLRNQLEIVPS